LLNEEIADVEEEFKHEVKAQENRDAIERDACLAPAGETWEMLLRQEAGLDRSIDRKVRIILTLRKEHAQQQKEAAGPAENEPSDREVEELSKLVGLAAQSERSAEEPGAEISKLPEKSENVLENKASAGQARRAEAEPATDSVGASVTQLPGGGRASDLFMPCPSTIS
jgi:predicted RNase H-like nuclease (RuvC/YqgF family)